MGGDYKPIGTAPGRDCSVQRAKITKDPDLGKISDNDMGTRYGVSRFVAADVRIGKGIPSYRVTRRRESPAMEKIKMHIDWLGVYYDTHIARELAVGARSVQRYRKAIGREPGGKPLPDIKNMFLNRWKRPKGIDKLLEQIND